VKPKTRECSQLENRNVLLIYDLPNIKKTKKQRDLVEVEVAGTLSICANSSCRVCESRDSSREDLELDGCQPACKVGKERAHFNHESKHLCPMNTV
jgi:hypothetical protein